MTTCAAPDFKTLFGRICDIAQALDMQSVQAGLATLMQDFIGAGAAHVFWLNEERTVLRLLSQTETGSPLSFDLEKSSIAEPCPAVSALRSNRTVSVETPAHWFLGNLAPLFASKAGPKALLAAPLSYKPRGALGVLVLLGDRPLDAHLLSGPGGASLLSAIASLIDARMNTAQQALKLSHLASSYDRANAERRRLRSARERQGAGFLLGDSEPMKALHEQIFRAGQVTTPVLLLGETGVGKELAARELHAVSRRADKPFVPVNCAALSPQLLESELFGHSKGAFTNATADHKGLMREADGGVLFLDEIGEMPPPLQSALLRSLQEQTVRPVGGNREFRSDFRLICATHRDLDAMVAANEFRADLLFRIRRIVLRLPALRDIRADLPILLRRFVDMFNIQQHATILLADDAWTALKDHHFPGNVRELQAITEQACLECFPAGRITHDALARAVFKPHAVKPRDQGDEDAVTDLQNAVQVYEKRIIEQRLRQFDGDRSLAAESLNINKRTFADRCKRYNL